MSTPARIYRLGMDVVIVGASLAGLRAAEALRREGLDGRITVVGAETHRPYDRPPLSKQVLAGTMEVEATQLRVDEGIDVEWRLGTRATGLDLDRRRLLLGRDDLPFDGLIVATGAHPRRLPGLPDLDGVHVLRTLDDCVALRQDLRRGPKVAVVGAGFIGAEVAATCHALGLDVTVIEALPVPMVRAIGEEMGRRCARLHTDNGVAVRFGVGVRSLAGTTRVEGVRLDDASVVPADVVVIGIGVAPSTGWLEGSGLDLDNGVACDMWCRAQAGGQPVPGIVAAGDVANWHHRARGHAMRVEHWTNAIEQAEAAAATLVRGEEAAPFEPVPYFWSDQYGTKIQFVGEARPGDEIAVLDGSLDEDRFVVGWGRDGRLVGALGFSRPAKIMRYRTMIESGAPWPLEAT